MTRKEVETFIEEASQRGSVLGLEPITKLLDRMDNPQDSLKYIHIAGTNGKGSILTFVSTILKEAGYKVGRYLSPVITEYREKIQVNEKMITWTDLCEGMELIKTILDDMEAQGEALPTIFEIETALCFWYFKKKQCDIVVLECGMGGETDATNVIKNTLVCAFAHIAYDHTKILGDTLTKIATVKSGIIKKDATVVTGYQEEEVLQVISDRAKSQNVTMRVAKDATNVKYGLKKQSLDYKDYKKLELGLLGTWQINNACIAIEVVEALIDKGYRIDEKAIRNGLLKAKWIGRFSIINNKPLIIMDGAHNPDAAIRLRESIDTYLKGKCIIYIVGVLADKEYDKVMATVIPGAQQVITITPPNNPRALDALSLAKEVSKHCSNVTAAGSVEEAVEMASLLAGDECVIIAFGSLSYLGRMYETVLNRKNLNYSV